MNHRITGKSSSRAVAPGVFGMLLALCLNLAVLPCAMALGIDDPACPHSLVAEQSAMDGHHGHNTGHADEGAAQSHPDCMSSGSSCCDRAVASADSRWAEVKVKEGFDDEPWLASNTAGPPQPITSYAVVAAVDPPDPPGTSVPRHVLFCVYLD